MADNTHDYHVAFAATGHHKVAQAGQYAKHEASDFSRLYPRGTNALTMEVSQEICGASTGDQNIVWDSARAIDATITIPQPRTTAPHVQLLLKTIKLQVHLPALLETVGDDFPVDFADPENPVERVFAVTQYAPLAAARIFRKLHIVRKRVGAEDEILFGDDSIRDLPPLEFQQLMCLWLVESGGDTMPSGYDEVKERTHQSRTVTFSLPTVAETIVFPSDKIVIEGVTEQAREFIYHNAFNVQSIVPESTTEAVNSAGSYITGAASSVASSPPHVFGTGDHLVAGDIQARIIADIAVIPADSLAQLMPATQQFQQHVPFYAVHRQQIPLTVANHTQDHVKGGITLPSMENAVATDIFVGVQDPITRTVYNYPFVRPLSGYGVATTGPIPVVGSIDGLIGEKKAFPGALNVMDFTRTFAVHALENAVLTGGADNDQPANPVALVFLKSVGVDRYPILKHVSAVHGSSRANQSTKAFDALHDSGIPGLLRIKLGTSASSGIEMRTSTSKDLQLVTVLNRHALPTRGIRFVDLNPANVDFDADADGDLIPLNPNAQARQFDVTVIVKGFKRMVTEWRSPVDIVMRPAIPLMPAGAESDDRKDASSSACGMSNAELLSGSSLTTSTEGRVPLARVGRQTPTIQRIASLSSK